MSVLRAVRHQRGPQRQGRLTGTTAGAEQVAGLLPRGGGRQHAVPRGPPDPGGQHREAVHEL